MRVFATRAHRDGAAGLAAILKQKELNQGKEVGFVLSGGNIDQDVLSMIFAGETPVAA